MVEEFEVKKKLKTAATSHIHTVYNQSGLQQCMRDMVTTSF